MTKPSADDAYAAVRMLIAYIGDDPTREGLLDTPRRVVRAWAEEWGSGYTEAPPDMRMFDGGYYNEMILVRDIRYSSFCEHHMVPFYGTATIGYIPGSKGVVGLSKIARAVGYFSRRLQVQERLTTEIADFLVNALSPKGLGVLLSGTHMCMVTRGVQQPGAVTVTSALRGVIYQEASARQEFLKLAAKA